MTVVLALVVLAFWPSGSRATGGPDANEISVAAAASLSDVLEHLARTFERSHGIRPRLDLASSGLLRTKIEAGAQPDVFLSASARDMDLLRSAGYLAPETRRDFLRNTLVCVVPKASTLDLSCPADLSGHGVRRIAIGDPDHVPAGRYGKQALMHLNLWRRLSHKLVTFADVRAALAQAEARTVEAAIVYASDAMISNNVRVAFTFPADSHAPIIYPVSVLKRAPHPGAAKAFVDFLVSGAAAKVFASYGFDPVTQEDG